MTKECIRDIFDNILNSNLNNFDYNLFSIEQNRRYILECFVEKLLKDRVIYCIDDIPKVINCNLFKNYKIYNLLRYYFKSSPWIAMSFLYPNKWNVWDFNFNHVPNFTWKDENNVILAIRDMVLNKIKIKSYDDIFSITQNDFEKYKLISILNYYKHSIPYLLRLSFPEYYLPIWRFKHVTKGYWNIQENRINAMKEFVEDYLKLPLKDIPKIITSSFLKTGYPKLLNVYRQYYQNNGMFSWINEVYPNMFKEKDFIENIGDDGTKLASREEVLIHNLLLNSFNNVIYYENENDKSVKSKYYNQLYNEHYIPDWILDENMIVEYFGLYDSERRTRLSHLSQTYRKRAENKIEYFTNYCNVDPKYSFVSLFPSDMKYDLRGVKSKLNII